MKDLNGWQNIGAIQQWLIDLNHTLTPSEQVVYSCIARMCAGYRKTTTNPLPYSEIAIHTNISERTIKRIVPSLIDKAFIIKVATNNVANIGKIAYAYQLNYGLKDFPFIDTGRDKKATKKEIAALRKEIRDMTIAEMDTAEQEQKLKELEDE